MEIFIKKILVKVLPLETYLWVISKFFFLSYNLGLLKPNPIYKNHYFIKNFVNKGDTVIDIGANLGYFTVNLSKWVGETGKVHSLEPVKPVRNVLKRNVGNTKNVIIYPFALGEDNKIIKLGNDTLIEQGTGSGSHYILANESTAATEFDCEMRKGSELFGNLDKINLVKCDIEGYELIVLSEMKDLFAKHKPVILVETRSENRLKVIETYQEIGFKSFVLEGNKLVPEETIAEKAEDDMFLFHSSKIHELSQYFGNV